MMARISPRSMRNGDIVEADDAAEPQGDVLDVEDNVFGANLWPGHRRGHGVTAPRPREPPHVRPSAHVPVPGQLGLTTPRREQPSRPEDHHEHEQRADPHLPVRPGHLVLKEPRQPGENGRAGHCPGSDPMPPNTTYATTRIELFRMKLSGLK